ncbi:MAG: hypothetical protein R3F37_05935 [Candidatus Competibacteraceae bacterium]
MYLIAASGVGLSGAIGISVAGGVLAAGAAVGSVFAVVKPLMVLRPATCAKNDVKEQKKTIKSIEDDKAGKAGQ